ncbi:hypothetical protein ACS0TY_029760 [Phlomoides rotata]
MGGGLVGGAALGAAFDQLLISVIDATLKVARFRSDLNRLRSTLSSIRVVIDDVESFNRILDRPLRETEAFTIRLTEGEKLIRKCSKVAKINVFMRYYYSKKISKLEGSLLKFFQMNVAALHFRETMRVSVVLSNLDEKVNKIITTLMPKRSEIGPTSLDIEQENLLEIA